MPAMGRVLRSELATGFEPAHSCLRGRYSSIRESPACGSRGWIRTSITSGNSGVHDHCATLEWRPVRGSNTVLTVNSRLLYQLSLRDKDEGRAPSRGALPTNRQVVNERGPGGPSGWRGRSRTSIDGFRNRRPAFGRRANVVNPERLELSLTPGKGRPLCH